MSWPCAQVSMSRPVRNQGGDSGGPNQTIFSSAGDRRDRLGDLLRRRLPGGEQAGGVPLVGRIGTQPR